MPLSRAATKIAGDYESCRRLCAKGIVPTAQRTADGRHWIVDVLEMQIAARHAGLIGAPSATFAGISRTWWPSFVSSRAQ